MKGADVDEPEDTELSEAIDAAVEALLKAAGECTVISPKLARLFEAAEDYKT